MRTTIIMLILLGSISSIYSQTNPKTQPDSLVHSFEDYFGNASSEERRNFEEAFADFVFHIDKKSEIRNMIEIFGRDVYQYTSDHQLFSNILDKYITSTIDTFALGFELWEPKLDELELNLDKLDEEPYVTDQLWENPSYMVQSSGEFFAYNWSPTSPNFIGSIAGFDVYLDSTDNYYIEPNQEVILSKIEEIGNPYNRYEGYVMFLYNLYGYDVYNVLFKIADDISDKITNDFSVRSEFKADMLLAINKILAATESEETERSIMKNFGRLHGILEGMDDHKLKIVRGMEVQFLNSLAIEYPRRNRFTHEAYYALKELIIESRGSLPIVEYNLSLSQIVVQQMFGRMDRDYYFNSSDSIKFQIVSQWRLVNTLYEIEKAFSRGEGITKYNYSRKALIIGQYLSYQNNSEKLIHHILGELESMETYPENIDAMIQFIPDLMIQFSNKQNVLKWKDYLGGFMNPVNEMIMNNEIDISMNVPFSQMTEMEKSYYLSPEFDSLLTLYVEILEMDDHEIYKFYNETLPIKGKALLDMSRFYLQNENYKGAYIFERIGVIINNYEHDESSFLNLTFQRDKAHSEMIVAKEENQKKKLLFEKKTLEKKIESQEQKMVQLNNDLGQKNEQLKQKEDDLKSINKEIQLKEIELSDLSDDFIELNEAKDSIQNLNQELKVANSELRDANLSLERLSQWLLFFIIILLMSFGLITYLWRKTLKDKQLVENQKEQIKKERDTAEGLRMSIGQFGHIFRSGIATVVKTFLVDSKEKNISRARESFSFLTTAFERFRLNRGSVKNRIEDEVSFAVDVLFFREPLFCQNKTKDEILEMIDYANVKNELVPIYTIVNIVNNFFDHSVLNIKNRLKITVKEYNKNYREINAHCKAKPRQSHGTKEGMQYIEFMIKSVYGGTMVLRHHPIEDNEYETIMYLNKNTR